jgi:hypothetical protein
MTTVKAGSVWEGSDRKQFIVLNTIEKEGQVWVHYRENGKDQNREYSCYLESFVSRFRETIT